MWKKLLEKRLLHIPKAVKLRRNNKTSSFVSVSVHYQDLDFMQFIYFVSL